MMTVPVPRTPPASRGFTLIEVVVVLLIVSVLIAMAAMMTRGVVAAQKRSLTATRMAGVDAALTQFVSQQKRLPCPADGTMGPGNADLGIEGPRSATTGCANQRDGVVPWRALGLTELDATDGWDRRLTYRVGPLLAADNGMNMAPCDPAGAGDALTVAPYACETATCSATNLVNCTTPHNFLSNNRGLAPGAAGLGKGLQVRDTTGNVLMNPSPGAPPNVHTGAAYVVISAGETGGGGYINSGTLGASTVGDGTEELRNYASQPFVSSAVTYFVDDSPNANPGPAHFDDIVSRPAILAVASRAGLGPRSR